MYENLIVVLSRIWFTLLQFISWFSCSLHTDWCFSRWSFYILHPCFLWEAEYVWQCFVKQVHLNFLYSFLMLSILFSLYFKCIYSREHVCFFISCSFSWILLSIHFVPVLFFNHCLKQTIIIENPIGN